MSLRPARPCDASSIAALSIEVWLGAYLKRGVGAVFADYALATFTPANAERFIADPAEFVLVSQNAEGIDGYIRLTSGSPAPVAGCSDLEIATLYVQPRHHGRGLGSRLLEAGLAHARSLAAGSVWLTTNAENTPAIAFYLARGFEKLGETHFRIADQGYLNNLYRRRLD